MMKKNSLIIIFLFTRILAIFFMSAILSDTHYYSLLAKQMHQGMIPYIDFVFEYPPLALFPIYIPSLFSIENYRMWFMILAFIFETIIFWKIYIKKQDNLLLYLCLSSLLLPFSLERLDIFMMVPVVFALLSYEKKNYFTGGVWSTIGGWLKLIPFMTYIGLCRDNKKDFIRNLTKLIILNLIILTVCSCFFFSNMFTFLTYHLDRPFQIESVIASVVFILSRLSLIRIELINGYGSQNVLFPHYEIFLKIINVTFIFFFSYALYFYYRHRNQLNLFDVSAFLLLIFLICSKVLSDQYFIWPLVLLALGDSMNRFSTFDKILLIFIYASTSIIFLNYWDLIAGVLFWQILLFFKNLALVYFTIRFYQHLNIQNQIENVK